MSKEFLNILGKEIVKDLGYAIASEKITASGDLIKSLEYKVISDNVIEISMNKYIIYVDKGTKPHTPPIAPLKKWVKVKGINANPYQIQKSIAKKGTKPHPILHKITITLLSYSEEIKKYFGINIKDEITKRLKIME